MSTTGQRQRIAVFVAFTALAAVGAGAFLPGVPAMAPSSAELTALEAKMTSAARLHAAAVAPIPAGPAPWCAECHPGLPHPGTGIARAMLNEHAGRMDCLLCHWSTVSGSRPVPTWQLKTGTTAFLAVLPPDSPVQDRLTALRAAVLARRRCFERGPACGVCHRPGEIGALVRPGSTPSRVAFLERLENHFTLAPGEKWFFPQIR